MSFPSVCLSAYGWFSCSCLGRIDFQALSTVAGRYSAACSSRRRCGLKHRCSLPPERYYSSVFCRLPSVPMERGAGGRRAPVRARVVDGSRCTSLLRVDYIRTPQDQRREPTTRCSSDLVPSSCVQRVSSGTAEDASQVRFKMDSDCDGNGRSKIRTKKKHCLEAEER